MVNGDPSPEGLARIAQAHRRLGTGDILPTVITDRPEAIEAVAEAALACYGATGILGLHIEGPHFSPARRGTHAAQYLRPLDRRTLTLVERLARCRDAGDDHPCPRTRRPGASGCADRQRCRGQRRAQQRQCHRGAGRLRAWGVLRDPSLRRDGPDEFARAGGAALR
ncbi:hypothetical protein AYJ57_20165 [Salipiger sp. CCB-MM3]|nr:hypothetical protein AYJ57_20165 [Salipiger sp. CCB-MM3]